MIRASPFRATERDIKRYNSEGSLSRTCENCGGAFIVGDEIHRSASHKYFHGGCFYAVKRAPITTDSPLIIGGDQN